MGWCMGEPYCPLSSATLLSQQLPLEMAESSCLPFYMHYLLFIKYCIYRLFISYEWLGSTVYLKIWLYKNLNLFTYLTMILTKALWVFSRSSPINEIVSRNRHTLIRKSENVWSSRGGGGGGGWHLINYVDISANHATKWRYPYPWMATDIS